MSEYFIVRVLSKYDIDDREIAEKLLSLPIKKVIENIQIFREENLVRELYRNDYDDERDAIRYLLDNIFNIDIEVLDGYFNEGLYPDTPELKPTFSLKVSEKEIVHKILCEVKRAESVYPDWPTDPVHAGAVLAEEAGEVVKAINNVVTKHKGESDYATEAIQCAAMCVRFLKNLDRYDWGIEY